MEAVMNKGSLSLLESFPATNGLPQSVEDMRATMQAGAIRKIYAFALGPAGTNISQAAGCWLERMQVADKAKIILCPTPEDSLAQARLVDRPDEIGLFGTCAVYFALHQLFFENPDALPFFAEEVMLLDEMQLAARPEVAAAVKGELPASWRIASHPSPAPLVRKLSCQVVKVSSNAQAADDCRAGKVEMCITTESARTSRGLVRLHSFGSPPMVFFYGLAGPSIAVVRRVFASEVLAAV